MEYLGGSAAGKGTVVTFSIDGGKTFDAPDKLFIKGKDGKSRPAEPKEYTHIRWALEQFLPLKGHLYPQRTVGEPAAQFRLNHFRLVACDDDYL